MKLVMLNNIFSFGDMTFKQMNGTAMGTPPAPPYATIYYGLHESKFLPQYQNHVVFYKCFIDDVLGIWLPHPNPKINSQLWEEFTASMNNYPGQTWEFNTPTNKVDFMDLTISITNGNISTSLFEKPLNLHLYIPPHSAHPPDSSPVLSTAPSSGFLPCARITTIGSCALRFFSKDSKLVAIRVITSNPYSSKLLHMHNATLDLTTGQQTMKIR